jgi:hypothetical protein
VPSRVYPVRRVRIAVRARLIAWWSGGGEEGVGDGPLPGQVGAGDRSRALDPPAGATGRLAGRGGRAPDDGRDVLERDGEDVVQDEGEPFGGRQRVQDDQQRGTD